MIVLFLLFSLIWLCNFFLEKIKIQWIINFIVFHDLYIFFNDWILCKIFKEIKLLSLLEKLILFLLQYKILTELFRFIQNKLKFKTFHKNSFLFWFIFFGVSYFILNTIFILLNFFMLIIRLRNLFDFYFTRLLVIFSYYLLISIWVKKSNFISFRLV